MAWVVFTKIEDVNGKESKEVITAIPESSIEKIKLDKYLRQVTIHIKGNNTFLTASSVKLMDDPFKDS